MAKNERFNEAEAIGKYKSEHLYINDFSNGKGRFFTVVIDDNDNQVIEYSPPYPSRNRIKITATFLKEKGEVVKVVLKKFQHYKKEGWVEQWGDPNDPISLSHFSFEKILAFLRLLSELDLHQISGRRLELKEDVQPIDHETAERIKVLLKRQDGAVIVDEILQNGSITSHDIVNVGYRRSQLSVFENLLRDQSYFEKYKQENDITNFTTEKVWQFFFEKNIWIFGFGLDYRFSYLLEREAHIGDEDIAGRDGPITDFLMGFTNFTVLVELKTPETPLFEKRRNRANSWKLSSDFISAVSQILEQKASWQIKSENGSARSFTSQGNAISQSAIDPKSILIVGSDTSFDGSDKEKTIKLRTFELFRRDSRNIEVITFSELFDRAKFIVDNTPKFQCK